MLKIFFIGSLVILSAKINVGCDSVIVDEWVGSFIMVVGASILFVCFMTFELVSTVSKSNNWCRDSTFLRVSGKCLKSINFGILNCCLVTKISCRGEWFLERNVLCKFRMISKLFCRQFVQGCSRRCFL